MSIAWDKVADGWRGRRKADRNPKAAVGNGVFAFWALALLDGLHTLRVLIRKLRAAFAIMAKVRVY